MAAITSTIVAATALAGAGMSAYGMYQQQEAAEKQREGAGIQSMGAQIQSMGAEKQAKGAMTQVEGARAQNEATKAITRLEFQAEGERMKAMEIDARRRTLDIIRNQQRARSLGLVSATAQGAQRGSGLQGAFGQISGAAGDNLMGVQQNLAIGRSIFGINEGISNQRLAYAAGGDIINLGQQQIAEGAAINAFGAGVIAKGGGVVAEGTGMMQFGAGMTSFGSSLMNSAPTFGNVMGSTFGSMNTFIPSNSFMNNRWGW